ncbi:MAG: GntR family transcriptional regulator [Gemmatimonadaceae bacterium]
MRRRTDVIAIVRERIVNGVHFGRMSAGDRLPSARRLAHELGSDPRIVTRAYDQLRKEGIVARRRGSRGYFAAADRTPTGGTDPNMEWLVGILTQALELGIPAVRFGEHARRSYGTARLRAACVECNHDQLRWLCGELEDDYGFVTHSAETETLEQAGGNSSALGQVDLIVTTAAHAAEVRPTATRLGKPLVLVTLRPEIVAEVARLLAVGPVYFLCTDPRFATKLRSLYNGIAHAANIRPVVLGVDDIADIPTDAPTWVMRTARERLGGVPSHVRVLSTTRIFSSGTMHDLLSHAMRANLAAANAIQSAAHSASHIVAEVKAALAVDAA